jgi:hypothetical protein
VRKASDFGANFRSRLANLRPLKQKLTRFVNCV